MSRLFFYDHIKEVIKRLPSHYKKRYLESQTKHIPKKESEIDFVTYPLNSESLVPKSYFDVPLNVFNPPESQKCLWGGEGIIKGYSQKNIFSPKSPRFWAPKLMEHSFYSEILDRWMVIIVSESALKQIEANGSFDRYILSTSPSALNSRLGMHLKRDMLMTLAKVDMSSQKKKKLIEKYSSFIVSKYILERLKELILLTRQNSAAEIFRLVNFHVDPTILEEAEWIGLTLEEAVKKQLKLEYEMKKNRIQPAKIKLVENILNNLENDRNIDESNKNLENDEPIEGKRGIFSRILYGNQSKSQATNELQ